MATEMAIEKNVGTMNNTGNNKKIRTHKTNDDNGETDNKFDIIGNFGIVVRGTSDEAKKLINYAKNELGMYVVYRTASSEFLWVVPDSEVEYVDDEHEHEDEYNN